MISKKTSVTLVPLLMTKKFGPCKKISLGGKRREAMRNVMRFGFVGFLGLVLVFTGCASRKKKAREIDSLQQQMTVMADELTRLDQQLQETRAAMAAGEGRGGRSETAVSGGIYRTPSGFELPSADIQTALKNAGYYQGTVDGKVGPKTRDAVKAFQRDNGLEADGVVGRRTWSKLKIYLDTSAALK